jgi:hypothetical protein
MADLLRNRRRARLVVSALLVFVVTACSRCADGRGGERPVVKLTSPAAGVPFNRTFMWQPVATATRYDVAVFAVDGVRTFEVRDLTSTGVKLADNLQLAPGKYFVQVTARRDSEVVAQSERTEFQIAQ